MTRVLFLHADITGRFLFREPVDSPAQPHLIRLSWLPDDNGKTVTGCWLVLPEIHWVIESDAEIANGISHAYARDKGTPLPEVMTRFVRLLGTAQEVAAFNVDFVRKVLQR